MSRIGALAGKVDLGVVWAISRLGGAKGGRTPLSHAARIARCQHIADVYGRVPLLPPSAFFPTPDAIRPSAAKRPAFDVPTLVGRRRVHVEDLSWESGIEPHVPELRETYLEGRENRTMHARVFRVGHDRPAIVAIHGYLGGDYWLEQRQWPIKRWLSRMDVALPLLPFHSVRTKRGTPPRFPALDPGFNNEGFRQAVHDIRGLILHLKSRGAPRVFVIGASLGGFTTTLLSTVAGEIDFAAPMIPLASLADFARDHNRLGNEQETAELHEILEKAYVVSSPFSRPSLLPPDRTLVIGGKNDRVTPFQHAMRVRAHLGGDLVEMKGAHLVQLGRTDAFNELDTRIDRFLFSARAEEPASVKAAHPA